MKRTREEGAPKPDSKQQTLPRKIKELAGAIENREVEDDRGVFSFPLSLLKWLLGFHSSAFPANSKCCACQLGTPWSLRRELRFLWSRGEAGKSDPTGD